MKTVAALIAALLLGGCSVAPSCFVGLGLTGPVVVCGVEAAPPEDEPDV